MYAKRYKVLFIILLGFGVFLRVAWLGVFPDGTALNQDEAFAGYEAFSLLHYGMDSHGYRFPVYLEAWGSGMNALNTYLMVPFVALLGLTPIAIRLPQAIVACFSLYVFYKIIENRYGCRAALVGLAYIGVVPWHIMLSRWGLESNLLPGFLLFGLYFAMKGMENSKFFMLSGLFYGLSLYCYASAWPVMPIVVIGMSLLVLIYKRGKVDKWFWLGLSVIVIMSIPLILFCLVNFSIIGEIKLGWMSIPKLSARRSIGVSLHPWEWKINIKDAIYMFIQSDDGGMWNVIPKYGLYYKGGILLAVIGLVVMLAGVVRNPHGAMLDLMIMIQGFAGCVLACLVSVNFNRINIIHIPIVYCIARGICFLVVDAWENTKLFWSNKCSTILSMLAICFYSVQLFFFLSEYIGEYNNNWRNTFHSGIDGAVEYAESIVKEDGIIYVSGVLYPMLLFSAEYPTDTFVETVVYSDETAEFLTPISFEGYHMEDFEAGAQDPDNIMICVSSDENSIKYLDSLGYNKKEFEDYCVYSAK